MKITAQELARTPASVYRSADKGDVVVINHDRYPDRVFELKARDRNPLPKFPNSDDQPTIDS